MKIKATLLSVVLLLGVVVCSAQQIVLSPQQANDRIAAYISEGDYAALGREMPAVREHLVPSLCALADALVAYNEGRHEESNRLIASLSRYEKELGEATLTSMTTLAYYNALALERYAEAGDYLAELMARMDKEAAARQTTAHFQEWMEAMAGRKAVKVKGSKRDQHIPIEYRPIGNGGHIVLRGEAGHEGVEMIFDTGCCFASCITEEAAQRLGVKVVAEKLPVDGVAGQGYAKVGVLPKLKIGDVMVKNLSFFIFDKIVDDPAVGKMEMVLGTHVIRALGELQFDFERGTILKPAQQSEAPQKRNLSFHQGNYAMEFAYEGDALLAHFDTGSVKTDLSVRFYHHYRDAVESSAGVREKVRRSGVGGSRELEVYRMPSMPLAIDGKVVVFSPLSVVMNGPASSWWGVMGADMLKGVGRSTVDLKRMFFRID